MSINEQKKLYVRTPLIQSLPLAKHVNAAEIYLKLENTQPSGSFKMRGISNLIEKEIANGKRKFVIASGGNAGLASAYCARKLGVPITVCVSHSTASCTVDLLKAEGATVTVCGHCWDDSNVKAHELARDPDCTYIHPFDDPLVWEGHASMIEEIKEDLSVKPDLIVTSVGGGGLLCGIVRGLERVGWSDVPVLGMETLGCDSYNNAVKQGNNVSLGKITSLATCLAALTPAQQAFDYYFSRPIISEVITDRQSVEACSQFLDDHRMLVEPACGAALAAIYSGIVRQLQITERLANLKTIVVIVCGGAGISLQQLNTYRSQVGL